MKITKGFTLVELLIVIAMLGILISVIIAGCNSTAFTPQYIYIIDNGVHKQFYGKMYHYRENEVIIVGEDGERITWRGDYIVSDKPIEFDD